LEALFLCEADGTSGRVSGPWLRGLFSGAPMKNACVPLPASVAGSTFCPRLSNALCGLPHGAGHDDTIMALERRIRIVADTQLPSPPPKPISPSSLESDRSD